MKMDAGTLEFLSEASQSLWRESSYDQLVTKFVNIMRADFGLEHVALYRIVNNLSKNYLAPSHLNFKDVPHFRDEFRDSFEGNIFKNDLTGAEMSSGVNHYHMDGTDYKFILLGDPATNWQILVWHGDGKQNVVMDFLAKQLQCGCSWFARLDKTQALLYRDDLTGLFNVRYLEVALESEIRRAQRFATNFSLLFIDLDNFKMVNDKFGHLAGSSVLRQLARTLQDASREVDSVIRYGGDEFVIMLLGANASTALLAAERIRQRVEDDRFMLEDGAHLSLTASIGVASFPDHAKDKDGLLKIADETMYAGKRGGKNRVVLFNPGKDKNADSRTVTNER